MNLSDNSISDQNIEKSLWYISHKTKIKKAITIFLIILIIILYSFSIFKFINIKISDYKNNTYEWVDISFTNRQARSVPQELIITNKDIIKKPTTYDVVI
ncbi:hypothetical protein K8R66_04790, partial [bacterium]|nr:hypothetical protein [bacterium]